MGREHFSAWYINVTAPGLDALLAYLRRHVYEESDIGRDGVLIERSHPQSCPILSPWYA